MFGFPSYGHSVPANWVMGMRQIQMPLGAATEDLWVLGGEMSIADKRNYIVETALAHGAQFVMFVGDDTIPPPHAFLQLWTKAQQGYQIVTGLYMSRTYPPQPMIWRGYMQGSYYNWHVGEFFEVDWAGCDCLLVNTDVFRQMPKPWFSQDYVFGADQSRPVTLATEDIYFYQKARALGIKAYCDTSVLCIHQDRASGAQFYLPADWPQAVPGSVIPEHDDEYLVADLGAGTSSPYTHGRLVRFDLDENVQPDVRCDL